MFELLDELRRLRNDETMPAGDGVSAGPTDVSTETSVGADDAPASDVSTDDELGWPDGYVESPKDDAHEEAPDAQSKDEAKTDVAAEAPEIPADMEPYLEVAQQIGLPNAEELARVGALPGVLHYLNNVALNAQASGQSATAQPGGQDEPDAIDSQDVFDLGLDANEFDPELVEKLNGMNAFYAEKFRRYEAAVQEALRRTEASERAAIEAERQRVREEINAIFQDVPDEYRRFIGDGETEKLDAALQDARANVLETMAFLRDRYVKNGQPVPSKRELMQEAVQREFVNNLTEIERERIRTQQKRATRTGVPKARAVKSVDDIDKIINGDVRGLHDPVVAMMP